MPSGKRDDEISIVRRHTAKPPHAELLVANTPHGHTTSRYTPYAVSANTSKITVAYRNPDVAKETDLTTEKSVASSGTCR
jgi:hypothetical protein